MRRTAIVNLIDKVLAPFNLILRTRKSWEDLKAVAGAAVEGYQWIKLDYPPSSICKPRWGHGRPPHPLINSLLKEREDTYADMLRNILKYCDQLANIPVFQSTFDASDPSWFNEWFEAVDAAVLYTFIADNSPRVYLEIGSGNSTKFAGKAISDHSRETRLLSIDPQPRAEIDALCDEVIRLPLEQVPLSTFDVLGEKDILFFDGSHRSFMNSDVTAFFTDILPRLDPGVVVGIHDIYLPNDYPEDIGANDRWYSEQYLLMAYLLGGGNNVEVVMPSSYVSNTPSLLSILDPLWERLHPHWRSPDEPGVQPWGTSFWMRTK
ncbi:class I SAM-dependent methyltransferase [Thermodesulfobacteriota bacterium]